MVENEIQSKNVRSDVGLKLQWNVVYRKKIMFGILVSVIRMLDGVKKIVTLINILIILYA